MSSTEIFPLFSYISLLIYSCFYSQNGIIAREILVSYSLYFSRNKSANRSSSEKQLWLKRLIFPIIMSRRQYCFLKLCIRLERIALVSLRSVATDFSKAKSTGRVIQSSNKSLFSFSSPLDLKKLIIESFRRRSSVF